MNIQTDAFSFVEVLILLLILGTILLIIIFKGKLTLKSKIGSISLNNKTKSGVLSPHHSCANRFQFVGIFRGFQNRIEELHKIMYYEIEERQQRAVRTELNLYYLNVVNLYKEELIKKDVKHPTEYWDYKYFKLIFKEISHKASLTFTNIIKTNGFLEFDNKPEAFEKYKKGILKRISAVLSDELDSYYIGNLKITREELSTFNNPDHLLEETIYIILDKILEVAITYRKKIAEIKKEIAIYSMDRLGVNIYLSAEDNMIEQERARSIEKRR